jgi:hypothetical protein
MARNSSLLIGMSIVILSTPTFACDKKSYTIGVQGIDYTPHYNFVTPNGLSFFSQFVKWLEQKTSCEFTVISLPIKRLNLPFEKKQTIDFIYPDNPNWHNTSQQDRKGPPRVYSPSLTVALGGTMVTELNRDISLTQFDILAIPRGFTPVSWLPIQTQYQISFR